MRLVGYPQEKSKWDPIEIDTGYAARVPVYSEDATDPRIFDSVRFLVGLVDLARRKSVRLCTYGELLAESRRQPSGRYRGYWFDDYNLFAGINLEFVGEDLILPGETLDHQKARINSRSEPSFESLVDILGRSSSFDAHHLWFASEHGIDVFLTLDFTLLKLLRLYEYRKAVMDLNVKVLSPAEFGKSIGLTPIDPVLLSYDRVKFRVRPDLRSPSGARRRPR